MSDPKKRKSEQHSDSDQDEKDMKSKAYKIIYGTISPVANPLANVKLTKKILKTIKKSVKAKKLCRGVKEVVKCVRKGQKGIVILAGDVSPMDVLSHIPILAEEASISYIFVPSKGELGIASNTRRPTSCLMLSLPTTLDTDEQKSYFKYYEKIDASIKHLFQ